VIRIAIALGMLFAAVDSEINPAICAIIGTVSLLVGMSAKWDGTLDRLEGK